MQPSTPLTVKTKPNAAPKRNASPLPKPAAARSIVIDQRQALARLHEYAPGQRLAEMAIKQLEHAPAAAPKR